METATIRRTGYPPITVFDRLTAGGDASIAYHPKSRPVCERNIVSKTGILYPVRHNDGRSMSPTTRDKMIGAAALFAAFAYFSAIIVLLRHKSNRDPAYAGISGKISRSSICQTPHHCW